MNSLSLILRVVAVIAAIAAGVLFYMGKGKLAEQEAAMEAAQQATTTVQGELAEANEQIETLEGQLTEERSALSEAKRDLENTRSEMYTSRQEVSRTQQQLSQARDTNSDLEATAKRLRSELVEVEQNLADTNQNANELEDLRERVAELEDSNAELKASLEAARSTLPSNSEGETETPTKTTRRAQTDSPDFSSGFAPTATRALPPVSIGPETTIQSISNKSGLIILANNDELQLSAGNEVTLVQNMKALGKISITQITEDLVLANILPGARTGGLSESSTVKILR